MTETALPLNDTAAATPQTKDYVAAKADKHIWGIYIALCLISIVELYSASSREVGITSSFGVLGPVVRHVGMLLAGLGVVWYIQSKPYRIFIPATYFFVFGSVALMLATMAYGMEINGAKRSISLAGLVLQPAEFIKLSAVLVVSLVMAKNQLRNDVGVTTRGIVVSAAAVLFLGALLAKQGATNTALLMITSLSMMLIGGVPLKKMLLVLVVYGVCGAVFLAYLGLRPEKKQEVTTEATVVRGDDGAYHVEEVTAAAITTENKDSKKLEGRLETWIKRIQRFAGSDTPKWAMPIDAQNRQEMCAFMAEANGGIIGVGPGNSRETARLPLAFSDFIYAIIIEDTGLVGGLVVLILYLWLLTRASSIASRCKRAYPALLVIGMAVMIVVQALVHMAITTGAMPVSGQPLPLISKGGSSILITSVAFGIMLSVSRYAAGTRNNKKEIKQEEETLPQDMRAENPTQLT